MSTAKTTVANPTTTLLLEILQKLGKIIEYSEKLEETLLKNGFKLEALQEGVQEIVSAFQEEAACEESSEEDI